MRKKNLLLDQLMGFTRINFLITLEKYINEGAENKLQ